MCILLFDLSFVSFPSVRWYCWFDGWVFWPVKIGRIMYIMLVQTLNHAQSIKQSVY